MTPGDVRGEVRGVFAAVVAAGAAAVTACAAVAYEHVVPGADGVVLSPVLSGDARLVAFSSTATNLLARVRKGQQVYVLDRRTHRLELASRTSTGAPGAGGSIRPSLSAGGRFVAFLSNAPNFIRGDHLFVSTSPDWGEPWLDVFVRERAAQRTIVVSRSRSGGAANGCIDAQIAAGGRYVVFSSGSSAIVRGDTNHDADVFVADLRTGAVRRVSTTAAGANGRVLAYAASDGIHAVELAGGRDTLVGPGADVLQPQLSRDGGTVVFARRNEIASVSSQGGTTTSVVTVSGGETVSLGGISATGRVVAFSTGQGLAASDTDSSEDVYLRP